MSERLTTITLALDRVAQTLGDTVTADRLAAVARILMDELNDEQILVACNQVLKRETRFPPPVKFLEYGRGTEREQAEDALSKVMTAINRFGDMNPRAAREFIGEPAWRVIQSFGGWYSLCTSPDFNVGVFRAQFLNSYQHGVALSEREKQFQKLTDPNLKNLIQEFGKMKDLNKAIERPKKDPC